MMALVFVVFVWMRILENVMNDVFVLLAETGLER